MARTKAKAKKRDHETGRRVDGAAGSDSSSCRPGERDAKRKKREKRATVAWSSTRPDGAYLYADDTDRTSTLRAQVS